MDEATVFEHVVTDLEERGYEPLVHVPGSHQETYATVLERCGTHRITIDGRYPDVLGFTNTDRVFAIEVKGSSSILKGMGQALTYQQGSHVSYLAAASQAVDHHTDLLRSKGIGVIGAAPDGVVQWADPPTVESKDQLVDIEGQLSVRLRRNEIGGDIAALSLAQPLNYLAPVVAVTSHGPLSGEAIADLLADEYEFGAGKSALDGAISLGLVTDHEPHELTDHGELAATVLTGDGITTLAALETAKSAVGRSTVIESRRPLGILLRNCFDRHPEFRLLVDAMHKEGPRLEFPDLLERLVHEYPNVFLGTFCTRAGRKRAREFIQTNDTARLYTEEDVWKDVVRTNVLFNFVQQLKHIGVLDADTRSHSGAISEYDPAEKPWHVTSVSD